MRQTLRALQYPNYRLFFFGQAISLIGTWLQNVGLSWLVYRLTGSAVLLGTIQFAMLAPSLFLSPFAGVWVDRLDRKKLLIVTQSLSLAQAAVLAALVLTDTAQIWHLIALAAGLGIVGAFDAPGRQTLVAEIVHRREDLPNAIALNSFLFNFARLIGPAIAGVLIGAFGEGTCFALNAGSYIAVIAGLLMMHLPMGVRTAPHRKVLEDLKEGYGYVMSSVSIRSLILLLGIASLVGGCYSVLLPVFASDVFKGQASTLGLLYSSVGCGALIAGLVLAARQSVQGLGNFVVGAAFLFGVGLMAFAGVPNLIVALPVLAVIGFGAMAQSTATNTLVQSLTDDAMRGRVMSFFTMAFIGMMPLGSFASGVAAELIGPRITILIAGIVGIAAALSFLRVLPHARKEGRAILVQRGLLPVEALPGDLSIREATVDAQPSTLTEDEAKKRFELR